MAQPTAPAMPLVSVLTTTPKARIPRACPKGTAAGAIRGFSASGFVK